MGHHRPRETPGIKAERLCQVLRDEHDVSVVPGRFIEKPDYIRISLCADAATLDASLSTIDAVLARP
jgi:aspartate/methionine/tyrosine aminotransferase